MKLISIWLLLYTNAKIQINYWGDKRQKPKKDPRNDKLEGLKAFL